MPFWYTDSSEALVTDGKGVFIPCLTSNPSWVQMVADGVAILPPPPPVTMPHRITRWQCAVQLRLMEVITDVEALEMIGPATPPAAIEALIMALPSGEQQTARERFGADEYDRDDPILNALLTLGTPSGSTPEIVGDDFFRAAGQLKP